MEQPIHEGPVVHVRARAVHARALHEARVLVDGAVKGGENRVDDAEHGAMLETSKGNDILRLVDRRC